MYHVSTQDTDECMTDVHYYYSTKFTSLFYLCVYYIFFKNALFTYTHNLYYFLYINNLQNDYTGD